MSTLPHITTNPVSETPSTSETAIGSQASGNLEPKRTEATTSEHASTADAATEEKGMSAEEAAEKLYEQRIEDEYAKREGGA